MGAWGTGNFENDDATVILQRVTEQGGVKPIEEAFNSILDLAGYIDVDYGNEAIAAAEVVAMLRGKPATSMPEYLTAWHRSHQTPVDDRLITKAIWAVQKATTDPKVSELRGLWEDGDELFETWYANITDLLERLRA